MKKWGLADSAACECGEPEQTAEHIINSCQLHRPPSEAGLWRSWAFDQSMAPTDRVNNTRRDDDIRKKKTGEDKLMAAAADKRACRKEGGSSIRPETTHRGEVCNKEISLYGDE